MSYLSLYFVGFLAITLILFYLFPKKYSQYQYFVLLVASFVFICWANWLYGFFVAGSALISYFFAIMTTMCFQSEKEYRNGAWVTKHRLVQRVTPWGEGGKNSKAFMIVAIIVNVLFLAITKYYNWLGQSIFSLLGKSDSFSTIRWIVPIGLSFYTFTLIAYNVDVYKGSCKPEKNFFKFLLFISYFPKLLEGPIMRFSTIEKDGLFVPHNVDDVDFASSFQRIIVGLFKKVLIADILGVYVDYAWQNVSSLPGYALLLVVFLYSIQIYCDFSGFIDMSLGISGLFGIKLDENFASPYLSQTISEFWRRWHISLGEWLKNYLYIPMGGNRVPKWRWVLNIFVVWLVSGFWHGASTHYVLWGVYYGVLLVISGLLKPVLSKTRAAQNKSKGIHTLRTTRTFLLVTVGWILFRAPSLGTAKSFIFRIGTSFTDGSSSLINGSTLPLSYLLLALGCVALGLSIKYLPKLLPTAEKLWMNTPLYLFSC